MLVLGLGAMAAADAGPAGAPLRVPATQEVREAEAELRLRLEARRTHRHALDVELRLAPELDLLARDDPPRPADFDAGLEAGASLSWAPLRNQRLLAEARVLEARRGVVDAWRDAGMRALAAPVEAARAEHEVREASRDRAHVRAEVAAAQDALAAARSAAGPDAESGRRQARRDLREARLDLREADLDLREAQRAAASWAGTARADDRPERPRFVLPDPEPAEMLALRARALRDAAAVALAERRAIAGWLDEIELEGGYHGRAARIEGRAALDGGRPRLESELTLAGTPQERWSLTLSAALRVGQDTGPAQRALRRARRGAEEDARRRVRTWRRDGREGQAEVGALEARLDLAEDRLRLAREGADGEAVADALDDARRAWLGYLGAVEDALDHAEAGWRLR